jgi:hypothetical protein
MRYQEPIIRLDVPLQVLERIETSLMSEMYFYEKLRSKGKRVNRHDERALDRALTIVTDAIVAHETQMILGQSLTDHALRQAFPNDESNEQ